MTNSSNLPFTMDFSRISLQDVPKVGGKNASLGQLFNNLRPLGIGVPDGFAITAEVYRQYLKQKDLENRLRSIFTGFDFEDVTELAARGSQARRAILETPLPDELKQAILAAYRDLCGRLGSEPEMAVRSSATAEDLPDASFAGAQETFLNVRGPDHLLEAVARCYASLFTDRAISYRARLG